MNRRTVLLSLIVLTIISSIVAVQSTNYFMADVLNHAVLFSKHSSFLVTFPSLMFSVLTAMAFLGIVRVYLRPNSKKRLLKTYTIIALVVSGIGLLTVILSAIQVYGSLIKPYPFPGYLIIFMIVHILVIAACIYGLAVCIKKMPEDTEEFKVDFKHVLKTIGWFLFISMAYNRLGNFFAIPVYIYLRNLYLSFPFFIYLLMPIAIGVYKVLDLLGYLQSIKQRKIFTICMLSTNVVLFAAIIIIGILRTDMVSAISFAMPLERVSSMPVEIIIHFLTYTGVILPLFIRAIKMKEEKAE